MKSHTANHVVARAVNYNYAEKDNYLTTHNNSLSFIHDPTLDDSQKFVPLRTKTA